MAKAEQDTGAPAGSPFPVGPIRARGRAELGLSPSQVPTRAQPPCATCRLCPVPGCPPDKATNMLPSFGRPAAVPMAGDNAARRLVGAECLPAPSCQCCSTQGHGQIPGTACQLLTPPGSTGCQQPSASQDQGAALTLSPSPCPSLTGPSGPTWLRGAMHGIRNHFVPQFPLLQKTPHCKATYQVCYAGSYSHQGDSSRSCKAEK